MNKILNLEDNATKQHMKCRHTLNLLKKLLCIYFLSALSFSNPALADEEYLHKFQTYQKYVENVPDVTDNDFINFIAIPSPLTNRLREKLLYKLAKKNDLKNYYKFYRPSTDISLQCYALQARLQFEDKNAVIKDILPLWLTERSQPEPCSKVFHVLLSDTKNNNKYINQRVSIALLNRNYSLASYLLKQSKPAQSEKLRLLNLVQSNPQRITLLTPGELNGDLYLYGLKRIARQDPKHAIRLFDLPKAKTIMSQKQQQNFLAYFALYKAMRNNDDAPFWLEKVNKDSYTDALTDWEMRYAIGHRNWQQLLHLIELSHDKENIRFQYWQARAYASMGNKIKAKEIYEKISTQRNYYGFLASQKLKKPLTLVNEEITLRKNILASYKPVMDEIQRLIRTHQDLQASRMINAFSSELGKSELSAFAYWVGKELNLSGKSIYLCNNDDLFNQLTLRFPLTYKNFVYNSSKSFNIPAPLIYAVIRQESAFFENIISPVGATGLMQIMPKTALHVARKHNIPYNGPKDLNIPHKNIHIGAAYLKQLSKSYNNNFILMAAAYNAGPQQVNYWYRNNPHTEMDIWIETIPWAETRNYIQSVIAFYAIYQYRLYQKHTLAEFASYF